MKNMILTSSLYESIELVKKFLDKNTESKKILFIPTATNVDEYKKYIYLTQKAFEDFGYEVENFDVSIFSEKTAKEKLSEAKIVFISGGNTFYLLQELKALMRNKYLITLLRYTSIILLHHFHKILLLHLKYLKHYLRFSAVAPPTPMH